MVTFAYDDRARLIAETRVLNETTTVYDISYTYYQLGNRLTKADSVGAGRLTCYVYDTDWDAGNSAWRSGMCHTPDWTPEYVTRNNRLLEYREFAGTEQTLERTVRYTYYVNGDASNITIKDEYQGSGDPDDYDWYYDLALYYNSAGKLWRVLWGKWHVVEGEQTDYAKLSARQFYYYGPFQRYLARDVDPQTWAPLTNNAWQWTDHERAEAYQDFTLTLPSPGSPVETRQYLAEFGVHGQDAPAGGEATYLHGDLIDSTMLTTDESVTPASTVAYSAFGEPIGDPALLATRYQYAGGSGYEADLLTLQGAPGTAPITLTHVGARWYQANLGRFVQRDPIGLAGGPNVYVYCGDNPVDASDPSGLTWVEGGPWYWRWFLNGTGGNAASSKYSGFWDNQNRYITADNVGFWSGVAGETIAVVVIPGAFTVRWFFSTGRFVQVGYRAGSFVYRVGNTGKGLIGIPGAKVAVLRWAPRVAISIPILFPGNVPGAGAPTTINCFCSALFACLKGWGL